MGSSRPLAGIGSRFRVFASSGLVDEADVFYQFRNPKFREEKEEER